MDARDQFEREYLRTDRGAAADLFLGAWAELDLADEAGEYAAVWGNTVASLASTHDPIEGTWYFASIAAWRWRKGFAPMRQPVRDILVTQGASGPSLGTLWLGLEMAGEAGTPERAQELTDLFAYAVKYCRSSQNMLSAPAARAFTDVVMDRLTPQLLPRAELLHEEALWAYLYATAIIYEVTWYDKEAHEDFQGTLPPLARALWTQRAISAGDDEHGRAPEESELRRLPRWLRDWGEGKRAFTHFS
jgi:hypothetical protein